jgi:hypothetical protein
MLDHGAATARSVDFLGFLEKKFRRRAMGPEQRHPAWRGLRVFWATHLRALVSEASATSPGAPPDRAGWPFPPQRLAASGRERAAGCSAPENANARPCPVPHGRNRPHGYAQRTRMGGRAVRKRKPRLSLGRASGATGWKCQFWRSLAQLGERQSPNRSYNPGTASDRIPLR